MRRLFLALAFGLGACSDEECSTDEDCRDRERCRAGICRAPLPPPPPPQPPRDLGPPPDSGPPPDLGSESDMGDAGSMGDGGGAGGDGGDEGNMGGDAGDAGGDAGIDAADMGAMQMGTPRALARFAQLSLGGMDYRLEAGGVFERSDRMLTTSAASSPASQTCAITRIETVGTPSALDLDGIDITVTPALDMYRLVPDSVTPRLLVPDPATPLPPVQLQADSFVTFAIDGTPTGVRDATAPALPDSGGFRLLSPLPSTQLMLSNGGPMFSYATSNEVGRPVFVLEDVAGTRRLTCSDNQDSLGAFQLSALAVADYRASFPMEDPNRDYVARLGFTSSTSVMATVDGTQFPAEFEFFQGAEFTDVSI